eukprot:CAMPEP_0185575264 /NCGR_PEP_ID=MMETSP0434-20130131/6509_1 /TAXON_ID=626734 ORGANISM="Favella taraikaensis, Strain Fe Narragansett Bay" /NCGR_SAMPLE_ID=MMETSP0434 /ASSEMBLY_ACC=CAM_ASM_000379 /LENGTH=49 /DNA_ID=CAMNT_0028192099 /DNA_START=619 /DNA_END=768 /DNA_ORIENTATION=+
MQQAEMDTLKAAAAGENSTNNPAAEKPLTDKEAAPSETDRGNAAVAAPE